MMVRNTTESPYRFRRCSLPPATTNQQGIKPTGCHKMYPCAVPRYREWMKVRTECHSVCRSGDTRSQLCGPCYRRGDAPREHRLVRAAAVPVAVVVSHGSTAAAAPVAAAAAPVPAAAAAVGTARLRRLTPVALVAPGEVDVATLVAAALPVSSSTWINGRPSQHEASHMTELVQVTDVQHLLETVHLGCLCPPLCKTCA